ncbi:hypothetical protein RUM44_012044 [Polyplax serrata]|uniref:Uncharacterized protein n=1 Tax=Polyplax serrata TaxID=468196 RepID=A0ABR1BA69_POLSC
MGKRTSTGQGDENMISATDLGGQSWAPIQPEIATGTQGQFWDPNVHESWSASYQDHNSTRGTAQNVRTEPGRSNVKPVSGGSGTNIHTQAYSPEFEFPSEHYSSGGSTE